MPRSSTASVFDIRPPARRHRIGRRVSLPRAAAPVEVAGRAPPTLIHVDLDALRAAREGEWKRLDALAAGRLDGRGSDELILRYQDAAADLSTVTTTAGSV